MHAGKLDKQIILRYPLSASLDRFGQRQTVYGSSSLYAEVNPGDYRQSAASDGYVFSGKEITAIVRNESSASVATQLLYKNKTYGVLSIAESTKGNYLTIVASLNN